jgi:signal transduction histidine kinase
MELVKKDNEIKEKELSVQRGLLFGSISTVLLLFVLIYLIIKRYNQKRRITNLLREQIEARTKELTDLNIELDTFLYRASHDFRGPLSTLIGLNHLGMLTIKDREAIDLLDKVGDIAKVMDKMLNKIAAVHIINREVRTTAVINVNSLCQEIVTDINCNPDCIKVLNQIDKSLFIKTDTRLLKIILENLIENAVKFRKYDTPQLVKIDAEMISDQSMAISVADTGKGIEDCYREKIFLPFVRAENEQKGNGLGLFLVKKCLQKIGGEIFLESKVGAGSTFKVIIPNLEAVKTGVGILSEHNLA